jgi:hypothetical protein
MKHILLPLLIFSFIGCKDKNHEIAEQHQEVMKALERNRQVSDSMVKRNILYNRPPAELKRIYDSLGTQRDHLLHLADSLRKEMGVY